MKKLFIVLAMSTFLVACDRSDKNQAGDSSKNESAVVAADKEAKTENSENVAEKAEAAEDKAQSKLKQAEEANKATQEDVSKERATDAVSEDNKETKEPTEPVAKEDLAKTEEAAKIKQNISERLHASQAKETSKEALKSGSAKAKKVIRKAEATKSKTAQNLSDGTYENGKKISSLSEEELRVGAQQTTPTLTKDEIQYFKSICRYALMTEQEIIDNGCTPTKVTIAE